MKTTEEILERVTRIASGDEPDFFGVKSEILLVSLPYEQVKAYLKDGITRADWAGHVKNEEAQLKDATEYIEFALGKAMNHRGLSANRSVERFATWAWLLGTPEQADAVARAGYGQYGVPVLREFAERFDLLPTYEALMNPYLRRMEEGLTCMDGCEEGCG